MPDTTTKINLDLKENKSYCPFIFRAANISAPKSEIIPCCRYDRKYDTDHATSFKNGYESLWTDIRIKAIEGKPIDGCWRCYQEEEAGISSMRTRAINSKSSSNKEVPYSPHHYQRLEFVEIQTGRHCNLKCRSCGPKLSTTWDQDLDKDQNAVKNFFGNDTHVYNELKTLPKTNKELSNVSYDVVKYLKNIKATGGEPFLNDEFQFFLANLVKWNLAKNINVEVFTNCSFFPKDAFREILPKFKSVKITLSLDAIESRAEFLRKGSEWPKVLDSAKNWKHCLTEHSNINLSVSHTISIFNILYMKEFIVWMTEFFKDEISNQRFDFDPHLVQSPQYLAVRNHKNKVKDKIISIIENDYKYLAEMYNKNFFALDFINEFYNLATKSLQSNDIDFASEFFEKTKLFDTIRNENWRQIFPELAEILDE